MEKKSLAYKLYWIIIKISRSTKLTRFLIDYLALFYYKLFRSSKTFIFQGKKYEYFYHIYNRAIASERIVEIPIAKNVIDLYSKKHVLEVGNVMAHYFSIDHDVLDKYEKAPGVINKDVVNFNTNKKYDLIISVSTMEHVGWDSGEKKEPEKFSKSLTNLKKFLKKGGKLFITCPVYYNPYIAKLLKTKRMPFTQQYFMKRTSFFNEWKEVAYEDAMAGNDYDSYYANANVLFVGVYTK